MRHILPSASGALVSCHLEKPLDDAVWSCFDALQQRRPGGFDIVALVRPPDAAYGEDEERWLERARAVAARGPFGLHTHWTSPTHARPTNGDTAGRVRAEVVWMRERGLEPRYFCGGGWYTDEAVQSAVRELGLIDCTQRSGDPTADTLPTTHSLGQLARAVLGPLPCYVHAYFHDYELLDAPRRYALSASLVVLGRRAAKI
ncbi:MAG TPA: hypothetical protein VKP14_09480 [Gaiellaceae bacterium]|nr:hypothetical protein [Gaiellaceae bacterium]